jgi:DNA-binding GntR family transcriptional regulator
MSSSLRRLDAPTLADQAYAALRGAIRSGELKRGQKITDRGLADLLAVSPTPVREAIRRLEQDRLVERIGPRSVRVATFAAEELAEISLIEDTLKALAARLAAEKATPANLREMESCLDAADAERAVLLEGIEPEDKATAEQSVDRMLGRLRRFHDLVNRACGNEILLHMLRTVEAFGLDDRRQAARERLSDGEPRLTDRYRQHRDILAALAQRDGELAERLTLAHTRAASRELIARQSGSNQNE